MLETDMQVDVGRILESDLHLALVVDRKSPFPGYGLYVFIGSIAKTSFMYFGRVGRDKHGFQQRRRW